MLGYSLGVLVLVAVAADSYAPHDANHQPAPIGEDNHDKLINNLKEIIEKSTKMEREALHKLHKELSEKLKEALKHDKSQFHKQVHESFEKIKKLEVEAQKHKLDIKDCLNDEEELKYLPREFYDRVAACDKEILTKSKAFAAKEKNTVKESLQVVMKLSAELRACGKGVKNLKCKAKVAVEITQAVLQEPTKIKQMVDEAVSALLSLLPSAQICSNKEARELIAKGEKIAKDIETCISKKFRL